jgi:DNA-binding MarR family transcriptional regulator
MEIGERLVEVTPGITRLIRRLEDKELVRRERSDEDRRQVLCSLTDAGRSALERLDAPMDALDDACMQGLSTEEQNTLLHLLAETRVHLPELPLSDDDPSDPGDA